MADQKKRALVLSHKEVLPPAIEACRGNYSLSVIALEVAEFGTISTLIREYHPDVVFIDGEYGMADHQLEERFADMSLPNLRVALEKETPISLLLLATVHNSSVGQLKVVFFIDRPGNAYTQVLAKYATIVWPALTFARGDEARLGELLDRSSRW